jgi:hypothetical protein
MKLFFVESAKFRAISTFLLVISSLVFPAVTAAPEGSDQGGQLFVAVGSGLPNLATIGGFYCPTASYFLQATGGSFLLESGSWKADLSGGWVFRNVGPKNGIFMAGIGYSFYYVNDFFLFSEESANPKFEAHNFLTLSGTYLQYFRPQSPLGWTAGLSLNGSTSGFLPELKVGLVFRVQ